MNYFQWVGAECGHHSTYTFYKGVKYVRSPAQADTPALEPALVRERWRVLNLGQFFFVKIWAGSDLLSVAELQLLWEDKERHHHLLLTLHFLDIDQVNILNLCLVRKTESGLFGHLRMLLASKFCQIYNKSQLISTERLEARSASDFVCE